MTNSTQLITTPNVSYSGCDMVASINLTMPDNSTITRVIGSLQTITYSIYMDKKPIRSLGNINPKDYVFGPRTIAGSLVFLVFNRHIVKQLLEDTSMHRYDDYNVLADELPPFDITISFANEYGYKSSLAIYGVRLVTEGQTMSINDIYTENTYQFVATNIDYLEDIEQKSISNEPDKKNVNTKSIVSTKLTSTEVKEYNSKNRIG